MIARCERAGTALWASQCTGAGARLNRPLGGLASIGRTALLRAQCNGRDAIYGRKIIIAAIIIIIITSVGRRNYSSAY